ncbi:TPA: DNA translocase FtsK, partial [Enterococcus faecium]|nr:DNA translocase FtsK [Enterococcus faecium]
IGIEVPNGKISMVSFREIIEAQPNHPDKLLEVPLGRDVSGRVQTADLSKMPHLLVAGSTGSGKSVAINGIITSILMRAKPHEVKLMMIDPKMVELNMYNGIPHLLTPVVTNPRKAAQALQKVVQEMEERYEKFAATGVRNISGYNEFVQQKNLENGTKHPTLPFIVVIVDELADLMMVASNEVEDAIIRLAQMARAAGIHMILATQRPSVDVITGIIKANVPSRMAFAVSSGTDSRTIIDSNGAEKLLGRGDMLFLPMGENKPIRVQGAFISDHEVERVVQFVTDQQEAHYEEKMMPTDEVETTGAPEQPQDELFEEAKALVVEMQTASISLLQRRFRIGYNRAARLVDELEAHGVVGPSEGSKPRKVFIEQEETSETLPDDNDM